MRESEAYLLEQGIEVVLKPFTIDQLESAVQRALKLAGEGSQVAKRNAAGARTDGEALGATGD